jgi:Tol biopolymer transport system component
VLRGARLEVRNLRTGVLVSRAIVDGGVDPVAVMASSGDSLEIVAIDSAGGRFRKTEAIPKKVPPRVVRVEPAPAATDVPLNRVITVVFSEPVTLASADGRVRLLQGTNPVAAVLRQVAGSPWRVDLVPQEALAPASEYRLEVDAGVTDQDGDELAAPLSATFATAADGPPPEPVAVLRIHTITTGEEPDLDGYQLGAYTSEEPDADPYPGEYRQYPLPPNGVVDITDLPEGEYGLAQGAAPGGGWLGLWGTATNCGQVAPPLLPEGVTVIRLQVGTVTELTYEVDCVSRAELFGSLEVTVRSNGNDQVYCITVGGYAWYPDENWWTPCTSVPDNGIGLIDRQIQPGTYEIGLGLVPAHCEVSPTRQSATIELGMTAAVAFQVQCGPPWELAVAYQPDGGQSEIGLFTTDPSRQYLLARLTTAAGDDVEPDWSPVGSRIVFGSGRDGNREIYVMNSDGSGQTRLTSHGSADHSPTWSPDGARIAFVSERDGNPEIYVMNADGSGLARLTTSPGADVDPDWSPDGMRIAFASERNGNSEIYTMSVDGSAPTRLTVSSATDGQPAWSPDGARIAFSSDPPDGSAEPVRRIFVMDSDGTGAAEVPWTGTDGHNPRWSPDGKVIAVIFTYCEVCGPEPNGTFEGLRLVRVDGTGEAGMVQNYVSGAAFRP